MAVRSAAAYREPQHMSPNDSRSSKLPALPLARLQPLAPKRAPAAHPHLQPQPPPQQPQPHASADKGGLGGGARAGRGRVRGVSARQARFHRNGDAFGPGKRLVVSSRRYNSLDKLLDHLSRRLLTSVVRLLDARTGHELRGLSEIVPGGTYVAAAKGERFKPHDYCALSEPQEPAAANAHAGAGAGTGYGAATATAATAAAEGALRARAAARRKTRAAALPPLTATAAGNVVDVYVQTKGGMVRSRHRFVANAKTARSLEQVLISLSGTQRVTGGVRRLYNLRGKRLDTVDALYDLNAVVAMGVDRLDRSALADLQQRLADEKAATDGGAGNAIATTVRSEVKRRSKPTTIHVTSAYASKKKKLRVLPPVPRNAPPAATDNSSPAKAEASNGSPATAPLSPKPMEMCNGNEQELAAANLNHVEYLVAQSDGVNVKAAQERKRQQRSIRQKIAERNRKQEVLESMEQGDAQLESALEEERKRQGILLEQRLKARKKPAPPAKALSPKPPPPAKRPSAQTLEAPQAQPASVPRSPRSPRSPRPPSPRNVPTPRRAKRRAKGPPAAAQSSPSAAAAADADTRAPEGDAAPGAVHEAAAPVAAPAHEPGAPLDAIEESAAAPAAAVAPSMGEAEGDSADSARAPPAAEDADASRAENGGVDADADADADTDADADADADADTSRAEHAGANPAEDAATTRPTDTTATPPTASEPADLENEDKLAAKAKKNRPLSPPVAQTPVADTIPENAVVNSVRSADAKSRRPSSPSYFRKVSATKLRRHTSREISVVTPDLEVSKSMLDMLQNQAATAIQARWRGILARRLYAKMLVDRGQQEDGGKPVGAAKRPAKAKSPAKAKAKAIDGAGKTKVAMPEGAPEPEPETAAAPEPEPESAAAPKPEPEPERAAAPKPEPKPESAAAPEPHLESAAAPPPADVPAGPPSRFSPYGLVTEAKVHELLEFHQKLGDGNFADVLRATDRDSGAEYAVKAIDKMKIPGEREHVMLENEIQTMRSLVNANCIELYDVFETEEHVYLIMELVSGGDLFDFIVNRTKVPEDEAAALVGDLAGAVAYMHRNRIIHRDLKPENILVAEDASGRKTLKLGDFGLSMVVDEPLYTICGTPTYVAPEIIGEGGSGYALEVDNWAIGVITYILLCGFPPFSSSKRNQKELFQRIRSGTFTFPKAYWEHISDDAKELIKGLLTVDPKKRMTAEDVVRHPWVARALRGEIPKQRRRRLTAKKKWLKTAAKLLKA